MLTNAFQFCRTYVLAHKFISAIFGILVLWGGYLLYGTLTSTEGETRYVLGTATRQTIVSSIQGSGQVSAENQLDLKPKASGDVVYIGVVEGQQVKAGTLIAQLDTTDAAKAVRDAEIALETASLSLQKLIQPADELKLTQAENSLARMIQSKQNSEDDLLRAYDDAFNAISNTFLDLPGVVSGLHDLLFTSSSQLGGVNVNNIDYYGGTAQLFDERGLVYSADANAKYQSALAKYNKNFESFKRLTRSDAPAKVEAVLAETYDTALAVSEAVKSANNLIQFYEDQMTQRNQKIPALADTQLSTLNTYTGLVNSRLTSLLVVVSTIKNDKNSIADASRSIEESTLSLADLKAGPDPLDVRSSELSVTQRREALRDANNKLQDYYVRAPFDGVIAKLNVKKGDPASSATTVATIVAPGQMATISLNEVDAAKVKAGQKVALSFDAVEGLNIAGEVAAVDTIGTVSQGVVTYNVKLAFGTQDERVKPGMSVSAAITTEVKQDVLAVPASAIKTQGENAYVEILDGITNAGGTAGVLSATLPRRQEVVVGMSNDTLTEIVSGLREGDVVITRTIVANTQTSSAPSLFGGSGTRLR